MADTCRGDFHNKYCVDCGHKGCYISHWGPLCPGGSTGHFDSCFSLRSERNDTRPFTYDSETGDMIQPAIRIKRNFMEICKEL